MESMAVCAKSLEKSMTGPVRPLSGIFADLEIASTATIYVGNWRMK
jgi:hypothetical protein